ncbi:MAG: cell division ATP-binding protein FtsE [Clostridiales Family XIII bacterium]|jgi:cell division transport system ATP-binding protein|nr:cell division ATP-binding protein FtsE [Clostridiales Family XIII bacterium]
MIEYKNVTKTYGANIGLNDANVCIEKGDFVFLVGPSGAGKSTFIRLLLREIKADSGSIFFDGQDITKISNREIPKLRRSMGIVFQDFRLLPKKTVYENVAFAMEIIHMSPRFIRRQAPQVLSLVGISDKARQYPDELSAGEQQRVAIARAIVNNPVLLIADEPTGNLDPDTAWEIMRLLEQINARGTTVLMVTHARDIVNRMGRRVIAINAGRIISDDEKGVYVSGKRAARSGAGEGEKSGEGEADDDLHA